MTYELKLSIHFYRQAQIVFFFNSNLVKTFVVADAVKYQDKNFEDVLLAFVHFELHNDVNTLIAHFSFVIFSLS